MTGGNPKGQARRDQRDIQRTSASDWTGVDSTMSETDGQAARFLRRNPRMTFLAKLLLTMRTDVVHAVAETWVFPDGSRLDVIENGPDSEFKAYGPGGDF